MSRSATKFKVSSKNQISIPKKIRDRLNIKPGDVVVFKDTSEGVVLEKTNTLFDYIGVIKPKKDLDVNRLIQEAREKMGEIAI